MPAPILYLAYLGGLGGGESSLLTLIRALDRTRFAPRVVCGTPGAFVDALRESGIPVEVVPFTLPYFRRGVLPTATLSFFPQLAAYLRAHQIRLVHCNDPESAYYAAPLARARGVPVVWTSWAWWQAERGWKSAFYQHFLSRILTPTEYIKQQLVAANPKLAARITVLPFGVDTNEFTPGAREAALRAELGVPGNAPVVTVLARFQSVKGHAYLLDAAPAILDAFPETRFLFVGDTTFETVDANATRRAVGERVAADARLRAAVVFCGFRRDVPRVLRASDILVCPSAFETYGMANIEAMACGIPVVSTNVGGPRETIVDGETGFLVPPNEPGMLAARVIELLGSAERRCQMGHKGRQRVLERYDLRASVARLERVYAEALGGHPA